MQKIYFISRVSISAIWFYHGLVPKIIYGNDQEVLMNNALAPFAAERLALLLSGLSEIIMAILCLVLYRNRFLAKLTALFAVAMTIALALTLPTLFQNAFNPFTLNLALVALAAINVASNKSMVEPA